MRRLPVRTRVKAIRALHRGGLAVPAGSHGIVTGAGLARFYSRTTYTVVFTPVGTSGARATLTGLTARDVRPRDSTDDRRGAYPHPDGMTRRHPQRVVPPRRR